MGGLRVGVAFECTRDHGPVYRKAQQPGCNSSESEEEDDNTRIRTRHAATRGADESEQRGDREGSIVVVSMSHDNTSRYGDGYCPSGDVSGAPPYDASNPPSFYNSMYQGGPHVQNTEQISKDKAAIYSHPLFPLLTCLFEKCELATSTPREQNASDVVSSASFKEDLEEFKKTIANQKTYYVPNPKVDELMLSAIMMFRFHLLELEKVHELCDNFCNRYVTCLKGKMPMDIVGEERSSSSQPSHSPIPGGSGSPSMNPMSNQYPPAFEPQTVPLPESSSAIPHNMEGTSLGYGGMDEQQQHPLGMDGPGMAPSGQTSIPSAVPLSPSASSSGGQRNGSTPLYDPSQMTHPASIESAETDLGEDSSLCGSNEDGRESVLSDSNGQKRKVPKVFPKEAINKFRNWLFNNLPHPYPSEDQKKQLAQDTGLTILQVNNWFINARRRIVQPMIDQSNRAGNRVPQVSVFKNRRRKDSGNTTPDTNGADVPSTPYSPDPAAVPPMMYPGADLSYMQRPMFPYPTPFSNPAMPNPMFMSNMGMFASAPTHENGAHSLFSFPSL